jgi:hypothetical protein
MKKQLITINTQSAGSFTNEVIGGRSHLVTKMVSIEGDSVMNRIFYPFDKVAESHLQLNNLIAPAGHPEIDGEMVSAFHPTAINSFNVGAFVRNPTMEGNRVINELVIDKETAEHEKGRELVNRIEAGNSIGVSTGLKAQLVNRSGDHNGREFNNVIDGIEFDHVAILLNEKPAGENTFTINSGEDNEETVIVCQVEKNADDSADSENLKKVQKMNKELLVLAIIGNANNPYTEADKEKLLEMDELDLANAAAKPFGYDDAVALVESKGFKVNQIDEETIKSFVENKEAFEAYQAIEDKKLEEMADHIAANSEFEKEELLEMGAGKMAKINNSLNPEQSYQVQGAETIVNKSTILKLHEGA